MRSKIRSIGRWLLDHWRTPAIIIALAACLSLGILYGRNNARDDTQERAIAGVVAQLTDLVEEQGRYRIDQGLASCERGNDFRAEIRTFIEGAESKYPGVSSFVQPDSFADVDCTKTIPGGTSPPSIAPPTTEGP